MRSLVLADIHANLQALEAVLADAAASGGFDEVWCLGDIVGYGPQPSECITRLRGLSLSAVAGNHDLAAAGAIGTEAFNPFAAEAVRWNAVRLAAAEKAWLRGLPQVLTIGDFTLTHGSLVDPVWEYLYTDRAAEAHLARQPTAYGFVGHTHIPLVFFDAARPLAPAAGEAIELGERRFVANPGGVGQPRDGDPRAAYAVVDSEARRVEFRRTAYDVSTTQSKMREAGLPEFLWRRLAQGR